MSSAPECAQDGMHARRETRRTQKESLSITNGCLPLSSFFSRSASESGLPACPRKTSRNPEEAPIGRSVHSMGIMF